MHETPASSPRVPVKDAPHAAAFGLLRDRFAREGWETHLVRTGGASGRSVDLVARRGPLAHAVALKVSARGRADHLVALWAQAALEAAHAAAAQGVQPLAVVAAPQVAARTARQVLEFAGRYAPHVAAGVLGLDGSARFQGAGLDALNEEPAAPRLAARLPRPGTRLFSDVHQWLLKVLLAPELPEALLAAPRGEYASAAQLARAAQVSAMTVSRFLEQLRREHLVDEAGPALRLARRDELLRRWRAWHALAPARELPMRFLFRGDLRAARRDVVRRTGGVLALFAAADALGMGFVAGVPSYVDVPDLSPRLLAEVPGLVAAEPGEAPEVILRVPPARQAVWRAAVSTDDGPATDVLQLWLDASAHPARGAEQAAVLACGPLRALLADVDA